jgi:hypothetical protein
MQPSHPRRPSAARSPLTEQTCVLPRRLTPSVSADEASVITVAQTYAPAGALALVQFYTSCSGENALATALAESAAALRSLNATVHAVPGTVAAAFPAQCRTPLLAIQKAAAQASGQVVDMGEALGCQQINPIYTKLTHGVACGDVISGIYKLWAVQLGCAITLWLLLFFVQVSTKRPPSTLPAPIHFVVATFLTGAALPPPPSRKC